MLDKETKEKVIKDFRINANDTGSVELQVAMLTEDIAALTDHLNTHAKDYSSKTGLLKKIGRRRKLLRYLEHSRHTVYKDIIKRLGLKK